MKKYFPVLFIVLASVLSACSLGVRNAEPKFYGLSIIGEASEIGPAPLLKKTALNLTVSALPAFSSQGIPYRLSYADINQIGFYRDVRFITSPAKLLEENLRLYLGLKEHKSNVCSLSLELVEMTQNFATPTESFAEIKLIASLENAEGILIKQQFESKKYAGKTAEEGVFALAEATQNLAKVLAFWLTQAEQKEALKKCQEPANNKRFSLVSAEFGIAHFVDNVENSSFIIEPAARLKMQAGKTFGWQMKLKTAAKSLLVREEYFLPSAPKKWEIDQAITTISQDRRIAISEFRMGSPEIIENAWRFVKGDPKGKYRIRVFIEDELVRDFHFIVD